MSIILSGPEPLRTGLENKLAEIMQGTKWKLCWIRGTEEENLRTLPNQKSNTVIPLATSRMTEQVINQSKIVIARAGYSTIMDVLAVQKPAILIPTPGQTEQEYLASNLLNYSGLSFLSEKELSLETIQRAMNQLLN